MAETVEKLEKKKSKTFKTSKKSKSPKRELKALPLGSSEDKLDQFTALEFLEYIHQVVGEKVEKNKLELTKPGKKRKVSKQKIEAQLREFNRDEQDSKDIEASAKEIETLPPVTFKDEKTLVIDRLKFFVNTFTNEFGEKLDQYTECIHEQQSLKRNVPIPQLPKQPSNASMFMNIVPQARGFASIYEYLAYNQRVNKVTGIINRLEVECRYTGVHLERAVIHLGCNIFQHFEYQYMALPEGQLQDRVELATDAVERIMNCLSTNYMSPEKHELHPDAYCAFLYRCFLQGKSKGLIGNYFPRRKIRQNNQQIKISNIYKKVGLAILDKEFKVVRYLKKKANKSNTKKYGYRICSVVDYKNEQDMETKLGELYEEDLNPESTYEYLLRPDDIDETVQQFLKDNRLKQTHFVKSLKSLPKMKGKL